ncbi:adrenodoxin-type ferredoxin, putative [Babesia bigemina]|uniref:Adrenodoxin-type ferredoxin, putative n=1 Tax=Babesia bigemina TaxID=5866 RepID=A0A061DCE7_BABBI|nr:adrenodoxin-type ferredoxin, putative [Babesia bigemina]CDR97752.1 adrenodoxin-type ferredoxin, putative [Babesia bigemina]|eukprot:XP_012769938.1 adrenodoxin-type ferredoxin, putative [Babesia bigemina]
MRHRLLSALITRGCHSTPPLKHALANINRRAQCHKRLFHTNIANNNADSVTFVFVNQDDKETEVTVPVGTTVLEAAHKFNIQLEGMPTGPPVMMRRSMRRMYGLLHVSHVYDALPEPEDAELDMLDLAPCLTNTSRLGCQIKLDTSHQGIRVQLPKITRNFYVDGHVPMPH